MTRRSLCCARSTISTVPSVSTSSRRDQFDILCTATWEWTTLAHLRHSPPNARPRAFATARRLCVIGGDDPHGLVQVYHPTTRKFGCWGRRPAPRIQAACVVVGSLIYVAEGIIHDGAPDCETTAFALDATTSTWSQTTLLPRNPRPSEHRCFPSWRTLFGRPPRRVVPTTSTSWVVASTQMLPNCPTFFKCLCEQIQA